MSKFVLDLDSAKQLESRLEISDYTMRDFRIFIDNGWMHDGLLKVIRGLAKIEEIEHIIDLDADPFIPDGSTVVEHHRGGQWKWNSEEVEGARVLRGHDARA